MFGYRRRHRSHHAPEPTDPLNGQEIDDVWAEPIARWDHAHGANRMGMTEAQANRFRALERAAGDAVGAGRLLFQKWRSRADQEREGQDG